MINILLSLLQVNNYDDDDDDDDDFEHIGIKFGLWLWIPQYMAVDTRPVSVVVKLENKLNHRSAFSGIKFLTCTVLCLLSPGKGAKKVLFC